ncbi:hypothetical protein NOCARDAX2BIS_310024 [Nocardioides sp. AX2bis]|nr:hypothetical protein NOCARDAX2BIS_310024 [Nocardioides sp. AX2bis]
MHHPRHRRRDLDRRAPLGGPRRPRRGDLRPRRLGGPLRPGRWPALPRHHRLRPLLRRGRRPVGRALRLAGRPRHLGCHLPRRRRGRHRCPPARHPAAAGARRDGPRCPGRPGHRPLGQLVQPGAVRRPHHAALGPGDRSLVLALRRRRDPRADARDAVPPDLPLRVPLEPRRLRRGGVGRPPVPARPRPRAGPLRHHLHPGPGLDREPAYRRRRAERRPRPAAQRVDLAGAAGRRHGVLRVGRPTPPRARGVGLRHRARAGARRARGPRRTARGEGREADLGAHRRRVRSRQASPPPGVVKPGGNLLAIAAWAKVVPCVPALSGRRHEDSHDDGSHSGDLLARLPAAPGALRPDPGARRLRCGLRGHADR